MDIIDRLNDDEMCIDAIDDAIREIETLRTAKDNLIVACQAQLNVLSTIILHGYDELLPFGEVLHNVRERACAILARVE